jgi:hypothetical protein
MENSGDLESKARRISPSPSFVVVALETAALLKDNIPATATAATARHGRHRHGTDGHARA